MIVDSHAHLDFVENLPKTLKRAKEVGVEKIITIGTTLEESKRIIELAKTHSDNDLQIWTTAGIHPGDGKEDIEQFGIKGSIEKLRSIAKSSNKIVAIGECGLDYRKASDQLPETSDEEKEFQRELFKGQIDLAKHLNLPLVIHCRNGWDEIFDLLKTPINYSSSETQEARARFYHPSKRGSRMTGGKLRGVFHSWTGDWQAAQKALDLGFYISFSGIVTFKNAKDVQEGAKKAPLERILIETDSPYLTPDPYRGQKNEPKNVKIVGSFIAELRNQSLDEILSATSRNVSKLFGL